MSKVNIIYQFNEKYVPYALVSMASVLENNEDVSIYVLGEGLSSGSVGRITEMVSSYGANVTFPDTTPLIEKFKSLGMIPYRGAYSVYCRLFFTELLDLAGERVMYLDADTIVDRSLLPLMEYDLGGKSIGMVLESIRDGYKVMIGMSPEADYYNSGVILFDVDKWVSGKYCEKLVDHIKNVRSSYIGDQDFLNIVCEGDVCRLPITYNFQPLHGRYSVKHYFGAYPITTEDDYYKAGEIEEAAKGVTIYHCYRWLGEFPWNRDNWHPFNEMFDKYMKKVPFVKEKARFGFAIWAERVMYLLFPKALMIKVSRMGHEWMLRNAEADARRQLSNKSS